MTIPVTDADFVDALNELVTMLSDQGYNEFRSADDYGIYSTLIGMMRDAYDEGGMIKAGELWERVKTTSYYIALDLAMTQGWQVHPNRQIMGFLEIIRYITGASDVNEVRQCLINVTEDCSYLDRVQLLQVREVAQTNLKVPQTWLVSWNASVTAARVARNGGAVNGGVVGGNQAQPVQKAQRYNLTDLGNAKRLVEDNASDIRYIWAWASWYVWDSTRWAKDESGEIIRRAKTTALGIYGEAVNAKDPEEQNDIRRWAHNSESRPNLLAMVDLARSEPGVPIHHEDLDREPYLLNVLNGTIDLTTGAFKHHRRSDMISKRSEVHYDANADCPIWLGFLSDIMGGKQHMIEYLARGVGYSLTGSVGEQVMFFCYGRGKNGKSTFLETLMQILGDYSMKAPTEMVMAAKYQSSNIPNDVARLPGARLVVTAEVEAGQRLSESRVKDLTGKDTIPARFMRGEWFDFRPTHKLWMYGNYKPIIRGADDAIWRRIHLIPFTVWIPPEKRLTQMQEILTSEASGILNWAVKGCLEWQDRGLDPPDEVLEAVSDYREAMDVIGQFLADAMEVELTSKTSISDIYEAYLAWCIENGETPLDKRPLVQRLEERGFSRCRLTGGIKALSGLRIAR